MMTIQLREEKEVGTQPDLHCKEDVEVQECFSSPEILELKAQCDLAPFCGAAPNHLQCSFRLAGPVFEVIQEIFVHNATAVKKQVTVFTLDLLMHAFFGRGELFMCHSALSCLVSGL
jgi:hypothetical protein